MQPSVLVATMRAARSMASSHAALHWTAGGGAAGWASAAASPLAQSRQRGMHSLGSSCHQALPSVGHRYKHSSPEAGTSAEADRLHVTVEPQGGDHEGVSVINLNRPNARNAIGRQLLRELAEAINILRQERSTRCVILRSAVPGGCSVPSGMYQAMPLPLNSLCGCSAKFT